MFNRNKNNHKASKSLPTALLSLFIAANIFYAAPVANAEEEVIEEPMTSEPVTAEPAVIEEPAPVAADDVEAPVIEDEPIVESPPAENTLEEDVVEDVENDQASTDDEDQEEAEATEDLEDPVVDLQEESPATQEEAKEQEESPAVQDKDKDDQKEDDPSPDAADIPKAESKTPPKINSPPLPAGMGNIGLFSNGGTDLTDQNIFYDVNLTYNGAVIAPGATIDFEDGDTIGVTYLWKMLDSLELADGDFATIDVPSLLTAVLSSGNLDGGSLGTVGTYSFANGLLTITFNDVLIGLENRQGEVGLSMSLSREDFEDDVFQKIEFNEPFNKEYEVKYKDEYGQAIDKDGWANEAFNPDEIDWVLDINTNLNNLTNVEILELIPNGLQYVDGSLKVYNLTVGVDGNLTVGTEVQGIIPSMNGNELIINLGNIDTAYRLEFLTAILEGIDQVKFENKATLTSDGQADQEATHTVEIERGNWIDKKGHLDKNRNPENVDWTLDINLREESLTNVTVNDVIPDGLTLQGPIKVYELTWNGSAWVVGAQVGTYNDFVINLGDIEGARRLVYRTSIDRTPHDKVMEIIYTNEATMTGTTVNNDEITETAEDTVVGRWDNLAIKEGKDVTNYGDREIEWTIQINKGEYDITNAYLVDIVGPGQEVVAGSIRLYIGNLNVTNNYQVYYGPFTSFPAGWDAARDAANAEGMDWSSITPDQISFFIDIGNLSEALKLVYRVKVTDSSLAQYTNNALFYGMIPGGPGVGQGDPEIYVEEHETTGKLTVNNSYGKEKDTSYNDGLNYDDKTMSWVIKADLKADNLSQLVIEDYFDPATGMVLLPNTIEVKAINPHNSSDVTTLQVGVDYEITTNDFGFTITFKDGKINQTRYRVYFKASFDPNVVLGANGTLNATKKYTNKVTITGKTTEGKDIEEKREANYQIKDWIHNHGQKTGQLDREERTIHWKVYVNSLGQNLIGENLLIADTLSDGQKLVLGSINVYKYSLSANGNIILGALLNQGDYTFNYINDDGFVIVFANGIDYPVVVYFDSKIHGISKEKYENLATVTGKDYSRDYKATVYYPDHDKFVDKNSDVAGDVAYTDSNIDWTIVVNDSLSEIVDATFIDTISSGQILVLDSIRVDGSILPADRISVTNLGDGSTLLEILLGDISKRVTITYQTVVTATSGKISNSAVLEGYGEEMGESSGEEFDATIASWGTGQGDEKRGSIEFVKVNQDGDIVMLPAEFELYYLINGQKVVVSGGAQMTEDGVLRFANLPFRTYYLQEINAPTGYELLTEILEIILSGSNRYVVQNIQNDKLKTSVEGFKTWLDDGDLTARPDEIVVELLANGNVVAQVTVSSADDWTYFFENLDQFDDAGYEITYSIRELSVPGYTTQVDGFNLINLRTGTTEVGGNKTWLDDGDLTARPETIVVELLANGEVVATLTVSSADDWVYLFENLDEFDTEGRKITYGINELSVPGYTTQVDGFNLINLRVGTTEVGGNKTWLDDGDLTARPETIVVELLANGEVVATLEVSSAEDWVYLFENLDEFDAEGRKITYSINELSVPGYTTRVDGFNLINLRVGTTEVAGTKTWLDDGDQTARPNTIVVELLANGNVVSTLTIPTMSDWNYQFGNLDQFDDQGREITYSINELAVPGYMTQVDGFNLINLRVGTTEVTGKKTWLDGGDTTARPETIVVELLANGDVVATLTVPAYDNWTYLFEDLDQFDDQGREITYTVHELAVPGYTTQVDGFNLINLRTGITEVGGNKTWLDDGDLAARPETIVVELLANGDVVATVTVSSAEDWEYLFENLDEFDAEGRKITYSINELTVPGYTTQVDGFNLINLRVGTTEVAGTKTWLDDGDLTARPETIVVELLANGEVVTSLTVSSAKDWAYVFANLDQFDDQGREITYSIQELAVPGYTTQVNGFDLINLRTGTTEVAGTKTWLDDGDLTARPETVVVELLANGEVVATVTVSSAEDWAYLFDNLDQFDDQGREITYSIQELPVLGYTTQVDGFNLINLRTGITEVGGSKTWLDGGDLTARPETIVVELLANGEVVATVTVSSAEGWAYLFENLDQFDEMGREITYGIQELTVPGYTTQVDGFDLINLRVGKTEVGGSKTWLDDGDLTVRPETIVVELLANGEVVAELTVSSTEDWAYLFENLDQFDEMGREITYSIQELTVPGYATQVDGFDLINLRVGTTEVGGEKHWIDGNDQTARPETIVVKLLANGKVVATLTVSSVEEWEYLFENLDEFDEMGRKITYTIQEAPVEGYTTEVNGFDLINTKIEEPEQPEEPEKPEEPEEPAEQPEEFEEVEQPVHFEETQVVEEGEQLPATGESRSTLMMLMAMMLLVTGFGLTFRRVEYEL